MCCCEDNSAKGCLVVSLTELKLILLPTFLYQIMPSKNYFLVHASCGCPADYWRAFLTSVRFTAAAEIYFMFFPHAQVQLM